MAQLDDSVREASNNSGEGNNQPGYNKMTGATTIEELRKNNSYNTSRVSYCWRWFLNLDEFARICIYFTVVSLLLTAALIIDAAVGNGPVPVKYSIKTSDAFCDEVVEQFMKKSRNSHSSAVLGSLCLLGKTPDRISSYGGGVAVVSKMGSDAPPEYLNFYGIHPLPETNPAPDNTIKNNEQPYPVLMQGMKIILQSRKEWEGERAEWTYSGKKVEHYSLDELFDYLIENVPDEGRVRKSDNF